MSDINTLCESHSQCPNIPASYFNQTIDITSSPTFRNGDLFIILSSIFAGYALLFILYIIITLWRNMGRIPPSPVQSTARLILFTITILIETFDIITDIIQTYTIFTGTPCGVSTTCTKQDTVIASITIPFITMGVVATVISIYILCKTPINSSRLNHIADYLKIFGENIPILLIILYWMFISPSIGSRWSFMSISTIITLSSTALNFYWLIIPIIFPCITWLQNCKHHTSFLHKYETEQQLENTPHLKIMATLSPPRRKLSAKLKPGKDPSHLNVMIPVMSATASAEPGSVIIQKQDTDVEPDEDVAGIQMFVAQNAPTINYDHGQISGIVPLPPGWIERRNTNGRAYYQNEMTHEVQFERPRGSVFNDFAMVPTKPSDNAPRPGMEDDDMFDDTDSVYEAELDPNGYGRIGKWCMWLGCVIFSIPFWFVMMIGFVYLMNGDGLSFIGLDEEGFQVISTDDSCISSNNDEWKIGELYSNITATSYGLYFVLSESKDLYPVLDTGYEGNDDEISQDPRFPCNYISLPNTGECKSWIFNCEYYEILYTVNDLCIDYCSS